MAITHFKGVSGIDGLYTGSKGYEVQMFGNEVAGKRYYVDGNYGSDSNNGSSWERPYKTLAVAMAASHANIASGAKGWAARNRIYFKADGSVEDLTKLARKTDVIGIGSTDWKVRPALYGNHVVDATTPYTGCRFINILFRGAAVTGGDIFTLTGQHGVEFHNCEFLATGSTTDATAAIVSTAGVALTVNDCVFKGEFGDAVIEVAAGQADDLVITDNLIQGANMGIDISGSASFQTGKYGLIKDNVFRTTLACINDGESKSYVVGNRGSTEAASGSGLAGAIVCNIKLAQDNRFSTSDANNIEYPALGSI